MRETVLLLICTVDLEVVIVLVTQALVIVVDGALYAPGTCCEKHNHGSGAGHAETLGPEQCARSNRRNSEKTHQIQ